MSALRGQGNQLGISAEDPSEIPGNCPEAQPHWPDLTLVVSFGVCFDNPTLAEVTWDHHSKWRKLTQILCHELAFVLQKCTGLFHALRLMVQKRAIAVGAVKPIDGSVRSVIPALILAFLLGAYGSNMFISIRFRLLKTFVALHIFA